MPRYAGYEQPPSDLCSLHLCTDGSYHSGDFAEKLSYFIKKYDPKLRRAFTPEVADRILEQEHKIYTEAINLILSGKYQIIGRRVIRTEC